MQRQCDPDHLPLRLSYCNRIANMRKQLIQLIDDRIRVEIAAYRLLHPAPQLSPPCSSRRRRPEIRPTLLVLILHSNRIESRKAPRIAA
jgi:hypothetical protein